MKVVITGARGLLGWHAHAHLHAANCAAQFKGLTTPFEIEALGRAEFVDPNRLARALSGAAAVLHFAGINRAPDEEVETGNPAIAHKLVAGCKAAGVAPHIVYANSTHAASDTPYGRSKRIAGEVLRDFTNQYTDLVLPHVFGETARPYYNNVTATLIDKLLTGETPELNPTGRVSLVHAGAVAKICAERLAYGQAGELRVKGRDISVPSLWEKLSQFHENYQKNIYPDLLDPFDLALFNTYRAASYPEGWPRPLKLNSDPRGTLFEAVKGGGGGQSFMSTTRPGITRGDHFHLNKVERFLVVQGDAVVRIRKVLSDDVWSYRVSGDTPAAIDMPTLHTHSIENVGESDLLTLFWTHDLFDPENPDTFADKVLS